MAAAAALLITIKTNFMSNLIQNLENEVEELKELLREEIKENEKLMLANAQLMTENEQMEDWLQDAKILIKNINLDQLDKINYFLYTQMFPNYNAQQAHIVKL